ncbi:unnamed protein product [Umbelopsis ramanniana]
MSSGFPQGYFYIKSRQNGFVLDVFDGGMSKYNDASNQSIRGNTATKTDKRKRQRAKEPKRQVMKGDTKDTIHKRREKRGKRQETKRQEKEHERREARRRILKRWKKQTNQRRQLIQKNQKR